MPIGAARVPPRLLNAILRLDDPRLPIAEVARRVGAEADRLGLPRPSYERLRVLVHEKRRLDRAAAPPATPSVFVGVWLLNSPPDARGDRVSRAARLGRWDGARPSK